MLGPDLDVEADLSIDSIKRLEILGELADAIGLTDGGSLDQLEDLVEELASRKTLRGVVDFLYEHADRLDGTDAPSDASAPPTSPAPTDHASTNAVGSTGVADAAGPGAIGGATGGAGDIPASAGRFVVRLADAPLEPPSSAAGLVVRVTGDTPLVGALVDELAARGIDAVPSGVGGGASPTLVVVADLLGTDPVDAPELYRRLRPLLLDTAADVLVVTPFGGGLGIDPPAPRPDDDALPVGAGARGLVKTAALEFPDRRIRIVDVDATADLAGLAATLADEVSQPDAPVEVAWRDGVRRAPRAEVRTAPAADPGAALTSESVVLVTGGGRGITAEVAVALARSSGCRLELVGRSPLPEADEDPAFAGAVDRAQLRQALIAAGRREPRAIEDECNRLLAAREIRATVAAVRDAGASLHYHPVDVRDGDALAAVVRSVYERYGRLDGIVHGAGVLDDHTIADKVPESFDRVFSTKVDAARTLLAAVETATAGGAPAPAFVVFFGSIAGACGNRGQVDYAAANDALDAMAAANRAVARRVVALDWGPWAPGSGMVSEELARLFEESGMGLIHVGDGTKAVLDEIVAADGAEAPHQIVVARCSFELMAASLTHGRNEAAVAGSSAPGH
jgi:NAD(P)-dependent dehydrogenase (short-subunit alcohol dehydrogenase family)